eukprot:2569008-Alexandrium_andersonii.AAC.1
MCIRDRSSAKDVRVVHDSYPPTTVAAVSSLASFRSVKYGLRPHAAGYIPTRPALCALLVGFGLQIVRASEIEYNELVPVKVCHWRGFAFMPLTADLSTQVAEYLNI